MKKLIRITTVPISLKVLLKDQLKYFNNYFDLIAVASNKKELDEVCNIEGVKVHDINMTRKITPMLDLISLFKMVVFFLKEKPHIVHTHTPKAGLIGMLAAYIVQVPIRIHTVAGLPLMEEKGIKKLILLIIEKLIYTCCTKVYPNSMGLYEYIIDNNLTTKNKLKVIGYGSSNGIDTKYFQINHNIESKAKEIKEKYKLNDSGIIFIFVGRIVKDKGINELISVFDKLSFEYNDVKLLMVGDFESKLDPLFDKTLRVLEMNKNIIQTGFQNDIRPFLAISNCFVLPTYREGFPNVVLQAGAMNLPCIVTNINGCNEIIVNNFNGLIIEKKSEESLYLAMKDYMLNNLEEKFKKNCRKNIVNKYERELFYNFLFDEYKDLCNGNL